MHTYVLPYDVVTQKAADLSHCHRTVQTKHDNIRQTMDNKQLLFAKQNVYVIIFPFKDHWSRIRQIWQTNKEGDMDQEDWQHESRWGELPIEPRMGQVLTYSWPPPEISPDEDFRREVETSITKYVILIV